MHLVAYQSRYLLRFRHKIAIPVVAAIPLPRERRAEARSAEALRHKERIRREGLLAVRRVVKVEVSIRKEARDHHRSHLT
jgi:hypothetical protein